MKRWITAAFAAAVLLMLAICLYAGYAPHDEGPETEQTLWDFSHDWTERDTGEILAIDGSDYAADRRQTTVTKTLPDPLPDDAVLFLRSNHNEISCDVNGRELFCQGMFRDATFGITYAGIWMVVSLSPEDAGQTVTLQIRQSDGNQGKLPAELSLANRSVLTMELARQTSVSIMMAFFMFALAIGLVIISLLLKRQKSGWRNAAVVWLALFIYISALWTLMDDNVPCVYGSYNDAWYFLSFYCFMLLPVPFSCFIGESIPKSQKTMLWFSGGFLLTFLCSVIAAVFFGKPLSLLLPATHILILAGFGAILFFTIRDRDETGKFRVPEVFWGLCIFVTAVVGALVAFYFGETRTYGPLFRFALLAFVTVLSFGTIRRALSEIERARDFEQLSQIIPSGISRLNCRDDFSILYGNDTYYRMFGYDPQEAKAVGFSRFDYMLLPEDRDRLFQELSDHVARGERLFEIEARARHRSGELLYMLTTNNYIPERGEVVSVLTNITLRKRMEEQLRVREMEFRVAAEQSEKYIMRYEIKSGRLYAHRKAVGRFGIPEVCENAEQALVALDFIGKSSLEKHRELFRRLNRGEESGYTVLQLYARDLQAFRWYHVDFTMIYDQFHEPEQAVISFYDITEQREKELAYERIRMEAAAVPQERITTFECNLTQGGIERITGGLINTLVEGNDFDSRTEGYLHLTYPEDKQALRQLMNRASLMERFRSGVSSLSLEFRMMIDGRYQWLLLSIQVVKYADNDDLKAFVATRDIDEEKCAELDMILRSETDGLTGIMNRAAYVKAVDKLIGKSSAQRHVLVMMDVDHFKDVNDTLGHDKGDQVLIGVAKDLRSALREGDLLGRLGGDEFSFCFLNMQDEVVLRELLERVRVVLNHDIGSGLCQSVSIGAAFFDGGTQGFLEAYQKADLALYQAKANGRNQYALYVPGEE